MKFPELNQKIQQLTTHESLLDTPAAQVEALLNAVDAANEVLRILLPETTTLKDREDVLEDIIPANNFKNQKVESWFSLHPIYHDERLALDFYETSACEIKFYWLNDNSTKARISAGVMLTPHWEDSSLTRNQNYKVGINFFLKKDMSSLLMAISNQGNLRVMEFSGQLTHTQVQILEKLQNLLASPDQKTIHSTLWQALALSEVNKKFYEGISRLFAKLCQRLIADGKNPEDAKMFASRLFGRLLFVWFLRKKNVIDETQNYFSIDDQSSTDYYEQHLKPLFFQVLSVPVHARQVPDQTTPYLNGGLFEPHENDWRYEQLNFPDGYFDSLYSHLNKYNFTTDESSPDYEQVAIDPEMLGRVFESLLAEQHTDSGDQARKAKGAFYTPREIVNYMCKESLRQYLYTELGDTRYHEGVDKLLDSPDYEWETAHSNAKRDLWPFEQRDQIIPRVLSILDSLTVLDPACGSGAFPMGMLQLLTRIYERLDIDFNSYTTKLNIIQKNIFGVDIEPMAVEISRLRAWLAIIVDSHGKIDPLPNLDFKFVCADSLTSLDDSVGLWSDRDLQAKMSDLRDKFFHARKPEAKEKWKKEYRKLTNSQASLIDDKRSSQLRSFDPFTNQHPAEFFDPEYMFGIQKFNLVIGNPPYVDYRKIANPIIKNTYQVAQHSKMINLYNYFFELGVNLLQDHGVLCYISPQQYLVYDNCQGVREFLRQYQFILLADFSEAQVFNARTYPFVSLIKKTSGDVAPANFYEYNQTSNLTSPLRELTIPNPIPEPVDISRHSALLQKINTGQCLQDILAGPDDIFVASSATQQRLPLEDGEYQFVEASNIFAYELRNLKYSINFSKLYSAPSRTKQSTQVIYTSRMTPTIRAVLVDNSHTQYLGGKVNVIVSQHYGELITALLNSKVVNFWFRENFAMTHMQGGALPINSSDLKKIPVPDFTHPIAKQVQDFVRQLQANPAQSELTKQLDDLICDWYHLDQDDRQQIFASAD